MAQNGKILLKLKKVFSSSILRFDFANTTVEFNLGEILNPISIDERITRLDGVRTRLDGIRNDLIGATQALDILKAEAIAAKQDAEQAETRLQELVEDTATAEGIHQYSAETLGRLLDVATRKARRKAHVISMIIGFLTGVASSAFVWWLTKS